MKRKPLTNRVRRGLGNARAVFSINIENGENGDFQHLTDTELTDCKRALEWLDSLLDAYDRKHPYG